MRIISQRRLLGLVLGVLAIVLAGPGWAETSDGTVATQASAVTVATPASGTPAAAAGVVAPARAGDRFLVWEEHVILQPEPAYSPRRVAMLPQGQVLEATGRVEHHDGETWLELRYPVTGATGWVSARWLRPVADEPPAPPVPAPGSATPGA